MINSSPRLSGCFRQQGRMSFPPIVLTLTIFLPMVQ